MAIATANRVASYRPQVRRLDAKDAEVVVGKLMTGIAASPIGELDHEVRGSAKVVHVGNKNDTLYLKVNGQRWAAFRNYNNEGRPSMDVGDGRYHSDSYNKAYALAFGRASRTLNVFTFCNGEGNPLKAKPKQVDTELVVNCAGPTIVCARQLKNDVQFTTLFEQEAEVYSGKSGFQVPLR